VRVGIVGVGMIAHLFHIEKYRNHPQVELVGVADLDLERAREVGERLNVPVWNSAEAMFAEAELDAVSVATFNESHVALSILALEHGLDVLVEKPMAVSYEQARQLQAKAAASDRICMVGMSSRFRYDCRALHDICASGELGNVYYAKARILRRRGVPFGWFTNFAQSGGGPMMDIGVHALDAAWWMMGCPEPEQVLGKLFRKVAPYRTEGVGFYSAMSKDNKENPVYDVEDLGTGYITFAGGAALTIEASWAVNGSQDDELKIELFGDKGGASLSPFTVFKESGRIPVEHALTVAENDYYQDEINHFIDCVIRREQPVPDVKQGAQMVRMLEGIRLSSESGSAYRF
jgi:predicted dehydrogenase